MTIMSTSWHFQKQSGDNAAHEEGWAQSMKPCEHELHLYWKAMLANGRVADLLCQEADAVLFVDFECFAQDGVEGLPGPLIAAKGADAEPGHPSHATTNPMKYINNSPTIWHEHGSIYSLQFKRCS